MEGQEDRRAGGQKDRSTRLQEDRSPQPGRMKHSECHTPPCLPKSTLGPAVQCGLTVECTVIVSSENVFLLINFRMIPQKTKM